MHSQDFFAKSDAFFKSNVLGKTVNYQQIKANPASLNALVKSIEEMNVDQLAEPNRKAFLINSYNLLVIHQVVKNWPTNSVMEIPGFFESNKFEIAGKKMTLNDLENDEIRKVYNDPRVHFVLVCGAKGCPPIINRAYLPSTLDKQLTEQTKKAMNDPIFIQEQADGTVKISEIFNWYREDFVANGTVMEYINSYRSTPRNAEQKPKYYSYDWTLNKTASSTSNSGELGNEPFDPAGEQSLNLQTYTAGSLLKKGQIDATLFNSIYTENENNWQGTNFNGYRTTFATSLVQVIYGVSKNARINLGLDVSLRGTGRSANDPSYSQIGRAFDFQNNDSTRVGISYIAPKIRIQPFKEVKEFTLQSSYNIVTSANPEGNANFLWIEWDRHVWWTQFFYAKTFFNDYMQIFAEADLLFRFAKRPAQVSHVDLPASIFLSYFPTKKITFYGMIQHTPRFVLNAQEPPATDWVIDANFTQAGLGFKYQFTSKFNIELLYGNFFNAKNAGLGESYNLGIKYILF